MYKNFKVAQLCSIRNINSMNQWNSGISAPPEYKYTFFYSIKILTISIKEYDCIKSYLI